MNLNLPILSKEVVQIIIENLPDGILLVNSKSKIIYVNSALETMTGYQNSELVGKELDILIPHSHRMSHKDHVEGFVKNPRVRDMGTPLNITALHKDGKEIFVDIKLCPIHWNGDTIALSILRVVDGFKDIRDDLQKKNKNLVKMNLTLENTNSEKNALLGIAAHDLRNPIGNIYAYSQLILDDEGISNDNRLFVDRIRDLSMYMLELVNDILDVSVLESGTMKLNLSQIDLTKIIEKGLVTWRLIAQKKEISLKEKLHPDTPAMMGDAMKVYQIIDNLVTNAIKYSPKKSEVLLNLYRNKKGFIRLEIKDQGPGIEKQDQDKIFTPFYKTSSKTTGGERSTGLGLAIVKRAIEAHQGRVWVESEIMQGSTFILELPSLTSP